LVFGDPAKYPSRKATMLPGRLAKAIARFLATNGIFPEDKKAPGRE